MDFLMTVFILLLLSLVAAYVFLDTFRLYLKMAWNSLKWEWEHPVAEPTKKIEVPPLDEHRFEIHWLGHSSWLIDFFGVRILTDPVFSNRLAIFRRLVEPPVSSEEVTGLDLILLSHSHRDHLDLPTLKKLSAKAKILFPQGNKEVLQNLPNPQSIMEPEQIFERDGLTIQALRTPHQGKRVGNQQAASCTLSYLLEKNGVSLLFIGDTAYDQWLPQRIRELQPEGVDFVLIPIGAYKPEQFHQQHCNPEEALNMAVQMGAKKIVPMHYGTFILSLEDINEPLKRFQAAAQEKNMENQIQILSIGEGINLNQTQQK